MKKILVVILLVLVLCGCSKTNNKEDINIDLVTLMENNNYIIVDVRTKEEYDEGHLVGAINIPYDVIDESIDIEKNNIVFVYCRSGNRSSIAYNTLTKLGYEVYDLGGYATIDLPKE